METSHFHYESGWWPRGKAVRLRHDFSFPGEYVYCRLDMDHGYWLLGAQEVLFDAFAHERCAHVDFLQAESPDDLLKFVAQWGPLSLSSEDWRRGESWIAVGRYRGIQRHVRSLVNLFSSIRSGKDEALHLGEFLRLRDTMVYFWFETARLRENYEPDFMEWFKRFADSVLRLPQRGTELGVERGEAGEIVVLLQPAPHRYLRKLMKLTVERAAELKTTLEVRRQGRRARIRPRLAADDLHKAIECMIILDEWADHPLQICAECARLFRVETRHEQRYCGQKCARRVSSREFKRKHRLEKSKAER